VIITLTVHELLTDIETNRQTNSQTGSAENNTAVAALRCQGGKMQDNGTETVNTHLAQQE